MPVCSQCGADNPDVAKFCLACGSPLKAAPPPQEFRKVVTIVFSDLKGSTSMAEKLDSEAVREVMSRYFDVMRTELERHGGVVEKYIGDAVMAVFGLPKLHEDDALRAVRAAAGMQRALSELNDELERRWGVGLANRTGVNTGEVVAGDPTTGQRLVTGDTVNVAARLEQAAPAMEVLLGELTYQLVRDAVEVEPVEPLELKGKAERVPAYRLVSVADKGEGWARRQDAPMVGRKEEFDILVSTFEDALADRSCRLVTVVGDAGVGKSRLNDEFLESLGRRAQVLRGRCLSYGEGITFWPLVEAVRQAAAIREDDPPQTARGKLEMLAGDGNAAVADRVAAAIGLGVEQFALDELFWGARKLLETLARQRPLVVLFDDIHWAEPTFLDLIEHLVDTVQDAPLLLLCPARHDLLEERPDWADRPGASRIILEALSEEDMETIVENLLGHAGIADDVRARIVSAAEGNPLFVEQMLSMLIDDRLLRFEDGRWAATSDLADLSVPPTIQALLAARLDGLAQEERAVVEPASVIGLVFPLLAVQELAPDTVRERVPAHLADLSRMQFVRPDLSALDEERFRFNHGLIREAAYNGLLKRARATFHERFVEWADRVNHERGREIEYEEILGYHLEQAHRYLSELGPLDDHGHALGESGARRLASAGHRAFARGDLGAAANLLGRAASLLPERDPRRLDLLPDLSEALVEVGDFEQSEALLAEATEAARDLSDARLDAHAAVGTLLVGRYAGNPGWSENVVAESARAIAVFEQADDHAGLAKVYRLLCVAHGTACQFAEFLSASEQHLYHARLAGNRRMQTHAVTGNAIAALFGPSPVPEAISRCEEALELARGNRRSEGIVTAHLAHLRAMQGDFEQARALLAEARATLEDAGARIMANSTSIHSGQVELLAGEAERAERELRRDYEVLSAMGETYFASSVAALLAEALEAQEREDEADVFTRIVEKLASADDAQTQAAWRSVRANLLAGRGDHESAIELAQEAVELLARTDAPIWRANAVRDYARVLRRAGRASDARTSFDDALRLYESKANMVAASRIRTSLEQLADESARIGA